MAEPTPERDDYDSPWKEAVEHWFPDFMAFYFPEAHARIDWSRGWEFLDQELREVVRDAELGRRLLDKLARVALLDGAEQWVHTHLEVQGERQSEFPQRVFVYNYRLFDRYGGPVASFAVLADDEPSWRPNTYSHELLGCCVGILFPIAKLTDYEPRLEQLLEDRNPFALVTAAHLLTRRTQGDPLGRFQAKRRLVRLLYQRGWDRQKVIDLFAVLDWLMRLPEDLNRQIWTEIDTIEERENMRYVTSIEQMAMQKGRDEGRDAGRVEGEAKLLTALLEHRFGTMPEAVRARLAAADEVALERWGKAVLTAPTLAAVFEAPLH